MIRRGGRDCKPTHLPMTKEEVLTKLANTSMTLERHIDRLIEMKRELIQTKRELDKIPDSAFFEEDRYEVPKHRAGD